MRLSIIKGSSYGITSGIITTLGLMTGLYSGTGSKSVVIGGIVTIAIADAFSDSLGIHISEESENVHTQKEIWISTLSTFISKFIFAIQFLFPFLLLPLKTAVFVSIGWGFFLLGLLSYMIAKARRSSPWKVICEHVFIAAVVIAVTHYVGIFVSSFFGM